MRELGYRAANAVLTTLMMLGACRKQETLDNSVGEVALAGKQAEACDDSLRPATGAPAPGLWLYERPSGGRVAAMIGPMRAANRELAMTRSVETIEVSSAGDTIRYSVLAAAVSLQLLPPFDSIAPARGDATSDSSGARKPAATYTVSPRVWLAAYEPCAASLRGPRIRYLRRDAAGRIVTDVLLHRTSE